MKNKIGLIAGGFIAGIGFAIIAIIGFWISSEGN